MYYWSRWTNITTESITDEAPARQPSWRENAARLTAQRETRPVIVVTRSRTQPLSTHSASQRARFLERETGEGISLDVQRSLYASRSATRTLTSAGRQYEATTQPVLEAFRLKP